MEKLCIRCLKFYSSVEESNTSCPICNFQENNEDNKRINNYCLSLYHFGWVYRKKFEDDFIQEGNLSRRYEISADYSVIVEAIKFLLLAVASGVTYDVAKSTIKKIFELNSDRINDEEAKKEFDKFIQYIAEYHMGKFSCDKEIVFAVREEELVHAVTEDMLPTALELQTNPDCYVEPISKRFVKACEQLDSNRKNVNLLVKKYAQPQRQRVQNKKPKRRKNKKR